MLKQFLRDRRAAVLPIFAIALIPLIVAIGAVIDYSRAYQQRTVVQDAMDSAALASGKKLGLVSDTLVKQEATNFYDANVGTKLTIKPAIVPSIVTSTITLTTQLHVPTYFLGLIGLNEFVFNLKSQSTQAAGTLEVVMALDNSGSMAGTKISTLITAASDLTDTLFALGATSTKLDPIQVGLVPFASSVKIDPTVAKAANPAWLDTTGVAPYNGESFEGATGSPPVSNNTPSGINVLDMFDTLSGTGSAWAGCMEERKAPYDVQDDAASTATPATMFVPMFAPDEPDNWTCTTGTCSKTCNSDPSGATCSSNSAGLRYNGAPAGTKNHNNYLPDVNSLTCSPAVTISIATPGVVTRAAHGFAAGTSLVFQTTGSLPTGVTAGTTYYVSAAGLTTNAFDLTTTTTGTTFTSSGTPVTTTIAAPAVFTSTVAHLLAVNDQVKFGTTGALPTGLTAGTGYYVKKVQSATTFSVSAASANTAATINQASPGVVTTTAAHGLAVGNAIVFQTAGTLPTGLTAGTIYYVKTVTSTTKFTVSATSGGTAINTTTAGSGTHSFSKLVTTTGSQSGAHNFVEVGAPTVFTSATHGFAVGTAIALSSTVSLPAPLSASTVYYVVSIPNTNLFTLSATSGGAGIVLTGTPSGTLSFLKLVATSGSQSGTHSIVSSTANNDWTCANGTAGCGTGSVGESEQTALLGQNVASNNLCKYGTVANPAVISQINVSGNGGTYPGGPNYNCTTDPAVPLTPTKATVKTAIGNMAADGTTNITAGLMWGWRLLSPTAPFTEGRAYSVGDNKKILILMTDGQNTYFSNSEFNVSHYGAWGYIWKSHLGTTSSNESVMQGKMEDRMELACVNIKAAGIRIYTVAFEITDTNTKQLLKDCATDPNTMAFDASDPTELTSAFTAIGDDISQLRLSQ